jgi:hypothetical protein
MTDTTTTQTPTPQTSDVVMQFLTQGGATVELHQQTRTVNWQYGQPGYLIGNGETRVSNGYNWRCLGCDSIGGGGRYGMGARHFDEGQLPECRDEANAHATTCRAMPKPTAA